ncbi:MAG: hypothetical protein Q7U74_08090 [Saprospiraceae bacterium]|nr:hypothetical protein [Saprospiraceae bacterium]
MEKLWVKYLIAYGMWAVFILLGVLFLVVSRNSLSEYLNSYYIQDSFQRGKEAQLINQAYFLVFGIILFILTIVVEEYFKIGARKDQLTRRIAWVIGIEILVICAVSLANAVMLGFSTLVTLALVIELAMGVFLVWFGFKVQKKAI